ncbi:hypothetical protein ACWDLG_36800 [Nonomuraea sp. NPDC003727]
MRRTVETRNLQPSYVLRGFKFQFRTEGPEAPGFGTLENQIALVYTRGSSHEEQASPLVVCFVAEPGRTLEGTENRPGIAVDLGIPGASAVYHDGLWMFTGPDGDRYWAPNAHSVTVNAPGGTYALRAPRDVGADELVKVARSLPELVSS